MLYFGKDMVKLGLCTHRSQAAVVQMNFRAGSTFPVPVCTVPSSMDRISRCNKVDAVRLYASYRLNLLLLKGQRCVYTYGQLLCFMIIGRIKIIQGVLQLPSYSTDLWVVIPPPISCLGYAGTPSPWRLVIL